MEWEKTCYDFMCSKYEPVQIIFENHKPVGFKRNIYGQASNTEYIDGAFLNPDVEDGVILIQCKDFSQKRNWKEYGVEQIVEAFSDWNFKLYYFVKESFQRLEDAVDKVFTPVDLIDFRRDMPQLRPYQLDFINQHLEKIQQNKLIIINCFCRFGKSYLMNYLQKFFDWNVVVITTKPTETDGTYFDLPNISIQKLKRRNLTLECDILFIDEAQEQFLTELTSTKVDLKKYKKVIFFSGTTQKLEENLSNFYLAHYNFGDYIQKPIPGFPSIRFHIGTSNYTQGIRLIFNRDKTLEELRETGYTVQSSEDESGLKNLEPGTYILNSQYTTGATIPNCYTIEIQNSNFTETDVQAVFRCFNSLDLDIERHVYINSKELFVQMMIYFYRQTGAEFLGNDFKTFCKKLTDETIELNTDDFKIEIDKKVAKSTLLQLRRQVFGQEGVKEIKDVLKNIRPETQLQKKCVEYVQKVLDGHTDDMFNILVIRLVFQLCIYTKELNLRNQLNPQNQDYSAVCLWKQIKDYERLDQIFCSFDSCNETEDVESYIGLLFEVYDKFNRTKLIKKIYELFLETDIETKFNKMQALIEPTLNEKKKNAEILTPQWLAREMVAKCVELIPGFKDMKIIEPCCGKGVFLVELHKAGCRDIHWSDINPYNVIFCNLLMNSNEGKVANALEIDYSSYDLVITNPPYNCNKQDTLSNSKAIFYDFCKLYLNIKYSCLLIPTKLFTQEQYLKGNKNRKEIEQRIIYKKDQTDGFLFGNGIEIKVSYYITDDKIHYIQTDNNTQYLTNSNYITTSYFGIKTNDQRLHSQQSEDDIICYVSTSKSKDYKLYIQKNEIKRDYNFWKVVCIEIARKQIFWFLLTPNEVCNSSFIGFKCNDKKEAQMLFDKCQQYSQQIIDRKTSPHIGKDGLKLIK